MRTTHLLRALALPLVAVTALTVPAHGAESPSPTTRADQLLARATAMEAEAQSGSFARHVRRTARLYAASAELRDDADPRKVDGLHRAGALLATQDPARAGRLLGEAAELALRHGEVTRAAHLYLDAAWLVAAQRSVPAARHRTATEYVEKARTLAEAPLLGAEVRDGILRRIGTSATLAAR